MTDSAGHEIPNTIRTAQCRVNAREHRGSLSPNHYPAGPLSSAVPLECHKHTGPPSWLRSCTRKTSSASRRIRTPLSSPLKNRHSKKGRPTASGKEPHRQISFGFASQDPQKHFCLNRMISKMASCNIHLTVFLYSHYGAPHEKSSLGIGSSY